MTRFFWVRHAPTHARTMNGWRDLAADLTDIAALNRLRAALPAGAAIISSDLGRAVATADAIATGPRLPHDPALREINFGTWEARHFADVEAEDPARLRAFWDQPGEISAPDGESWDDLTSRVWAATDRLAAAHQGRDLIVVAHFGAILAALQRALDVPALQAFAQKIDPLSLTEIACDGRDWTVRRINHRV